MHIALYSEQPLLIIVPVLRTGSVDAKYVAANFRMLMFINHHGNTCVRPSVHEKKGYVNFAHLLSSDA
jgi:hypothetical protein